MTKFMAIVSAEKGAGRTTVALNLGAALSALGKDVIVMDASVENPSVSSYLGARDVPVHLHDALDGRSHVRDAIYRHPSGLKIIPASPLRHHSTIDLGRFPDIILDLVGSAELVIMDTSPGLGKETEAVVHAASEALVVARPDMRSITEAIRTIRAVGNTRCTMIGVVANRVGRSKGEVPIQKMERILDHPVIVEIPEDGRMQRAHALKHPLAYTHPRSPASRGYRRLATLVYGEQFGKEFPEDRSMLHGILRFVGLG